MCRCNVLILKAANDDCPPTVPLYQVSSRYRWADRLSAAEPSHSPTANEADEQRYTDAEQRSGVVNRE